jgi:GR25 family glycosyltransferase involved in LPS biosynthesis
MADDLDRARRDINVLFPHKVCINLDRRPDRWERVSGAFARHGIEGVVRFPAVDGRRVVPPPGSLLRSGEYGCLRSHLAVVRQFRHCPRLLIFEDDCLFVADFRERFAEYAAQLPEDWHLLYFGDQREGRPDPVSVSRNLVRARSVWRTHAYALKQSVYDAFLAFGSHAIAPVDVCAVAMQEIFSAYCFMPRLAWQSHAESDIQYSP